MFNLCLQLLAIHLQSYAFNVRRITNSSSAQIHYLCLILIKLHYLKISVNVSGVNFSKICATTTTKFDYCHILTFTLHKYKSWSMPQVTGVNFLTSHCNKLDLYACLLICVYVRRNSFLWMKILISGLILQWEKIWYFWVCTIGMLYSIIPT